MKNRTRLLAAVIATSLLGGCATPDGKPILGSHAMDNCVGYGLAAAGGVEVVGRLFNANSKGTNIAALGAGAFACQRGYMNGKVLDNALRVQQQIAQESRFQPVFVNSNNQVIQQQTVIAVAQNPQASVSQQDKPKALQLPIAQVEMIQRNPHGLTSRAINSLQRMDTLAAQSDAEMMVYIPTSQKSFQNAIGGVAPHARLMETAGRDFLVIVQPRG